MAENIVIPEQIFIGYSIRNNFKEKLAFGTYYEDNAACRKRQSTINNWIDKDIPTEIIDNKPRAGYKLNERVTHGGGWNDLNVYWRIVDPRGFELEISSGNLAKLFQYCTIDHGLIKEECVWGWDKGNGSKVVLLPVNSEIYENSVVSTNRHNAKSLALKDINLGDMVELKNGTKGTFFGKVTHGWYNSTSGHNRAQIKFESSYVIKVDDKDYGGNDIQRLYFVKAPKIISAQDCEKPYTKEEAEIMLNKLLNEKNTHLDATFSYSIVNTFYLTYDDPSLCKAEYVINKMDLKESISYMRNLWTSKSKELTHYNLDSHFRYLGSYANPLILKYKNKYHYVIGVNEVGKKSNPAFNKNDFELFIDGTTDKINFLCYEMEPLKGIDVGIEIIPNPHYDGRSSYSPHNSSYRTVILSFDQCEEIFTFQIKFKDLVKDLYR